MPEGRTSSVVDEVIVSGPDGRPVDVTDHGDGTYSFGQPGGPVTIAGTFRPAGGWTDCLRDESCPMAGFRDVDMRAWYHDGLHCCVERRLMAGTGPDAFAPRDVTHPGHDCDQPLAAGGQPQGGGFHSVR